MRKKGMFFLGIVVSILYITSTISMANMTLQSGTIQYEPGELKFNPGKIDPETGAPIDPETNEPEIAQVGGNFKSQLPTHLNFGYHKIQSQTEEHWVAKNINAPENASFDTLSFLYQESNDLTVGTMSVGDDRGKEVGWHVKVKQNGQFTVADAPDYPLIGARLNMKLGKLSNNLTTDLAGFKVMGAAINAVQTVVFDAENETEVIIVSAEKGVGAGVTRLPLTEFSLFVPQGVNKANGDYQTSMTWTLSDTPVGIGEGD